jgi:hypothetical protein
MWRVKNETGLHKPRLRLNAADPPKVVRQIPDVGVNGGSS